MTERDERGTAVRAIDAPAWSVDSLVAALLLRDARPVPLIALAGAVVLAACWAVFSPPI